MRQEEGGPVAVASEAVLPHPDAEPS
jgi:hypothetical protein